MIAWGSSSARNSGAASQEGCAGAGAIQASGAIWDELDRHPDALGAALLVHQAGAVGRDDVFGPAPRVIADLVVRPILVEDDFS